MPLYEYKCLDCGKDYEELVSISEKKNPPCPSCKGENVEKKISLFGSAGSSSCGTSGFS